MEPSNPSPAQGHEAYLEEVELLRDEISTAMLAISENTLEALEQSLWRQQVLCVSVKRLLESIHRTEIDSAAMTRVRSATTALHTLNQSYATLVQQSRSSADLLYSLCRSYRDASHREPGSDAHRCSLEA